MKRLTIVAALLATISATCVAGPNSSELKSFKALVTDYSSTSGGMSPAVTIDGSKLAYYTGNQSFPECGDIYIQSFGQPNVRILGESQMFYNSANVTTWKLPAPDADGWYWNSESMQKTRNMDWSRNGKSLAFIGKNGSLYVADEIDSTKKTSEIRKLVDVHSTDGDIHQPRWSPDGTMIAYGRSDEGKQSSVCIVDAESGKVTVLANDGQSSPFLWEQPWSPDSKRLIYAGGKERPSVTFSLKMTPESGAKSKKSTENTSKDTGGYIALVSVDGKERSILESGRGGVNPSWSAKGNKVAFSAPAHYTAKLGGDASLEGSTLVIYTSAVPSKTRTAVSPSPMQTGNNGLEIANTIMNGMRAHFVADYGDKLSTQQLQRLKANKTTFVEMNDIVEKLFARDPAAAAEVPLPPAAEAMHLPAEKSLKAKALMKVFETFAKSLEDVDKPLLKKLAMSDFEPVWSPDGNEIAFIRSVPEEELDGQLFVKNISTGKTRLLAQDAHLSCISWTEYGRLLVMQTKRLMAKDANDYETSTTYGYPEIWLLEPK